MIETRTIAVGTARIAVQLRGTGPLCVFVHGYPLNASMWSEVMQSDLARGDLAYCDLAARRTLCAIDLRGHGASPHAGDAVHSMELFADDVAAVIRTLSDEPADIVGLSMGGYALLSFAERHATLLRSLTLVDTRAGEDAPAGKEARRAAMAQVVEHGRHWLANQMLTKLVAKDCGLPVRARLQSMIESTPVETILADLQGMLDRPDRHAVLRGLRVPGLVVVGSEDALTPVAMAQEMVDAFPGSRMSVIPGVGHMAPMEAPVEFLRALGGFLE